MIQYRTRDMKYTLHINSSQFSLAMQYCASVMCAMAFCLSVCLLLLVTVWKQLNILSNLFTAS